MNKIANIFLKWYLFIAISLIGSISLGAQNNAYLNYIDKYAPLAIQQMRTYKIPASITLAQGLLESNAGRSRLATNANNHFGIKVTSDWCGPYILANDDRPNERFRKYRCAKDSYQDHSAFLQRPRYAALFQLSIQDYRGWAHGLKKAGYATHPRYAHNLIHIIETYQLDRYDRMKSFTSYRGQQNQCETLHFGTCNDCPYIIMSESMDFKTLSKIVGVSARKLRKYNEMPKNIALQPGDIVYLVKKKRKVAKTKRGLRYEIQSGESLHDVSQRFGVRLQYLLKRNPQYKTQTPSTGDSLLL